MRAKISTLHVFQLVSQVNFVVPERYYFVRRCAILYFFKRVSVENSPNVGLEPTTLRLRVSCSTD